MYVINMLNCNGLFSSHEKERARQRDRRGPLTKKERKEKERKKKKSGW